MYGSWRQFGQKDILLPFLKIAKDSAMLGVQLQVRYTDTKHANGETHEYVMIKEKMDHRKPGKFVPFSARIFGANFYGIAPHR